MDREELLRKYRPVLLGFLADCYASRRVPPSEFGMIVDDQSRKVDLIIDQIRKDCQCSSETKPRLNGSAINADANSAVKKSEAEPTRTTASSLAGPAASTSPKTSLPYAPPIMSKPTTITNSTNR